jgi:hypothetical protein
LTFTRALPLAEDELGRAEGDRVAVAELRALHPLSVQLGAVGRAEIDEPPAAAFAAQLGVAARDVRVLDLDIAVLRAAEHDLGALERVRAPVHRQREGLVLEPELGRRDRLGRLRRLRLVDHRRARLDLGVGLVQLWPPPALRLHHPRRDPELADREVRVRQHQHLRRRQHRVALAARVLDQMILQLADERALVARELLAIGLGQVDRVLVRDVDARDGDRPVLVHLLRELARQLDRLHVRAESATEHPLEEAFDLLLDAPEDTHGEGDDAPGSRV